MDQEIQEFIENNIEAIEKGDWKAVYNEAFKLRHPGELTIALNAAGIYPLSYLNYIPAFYLGGTKILSYVILPGMESIHTEAFAGCMNLESIYIPKTVSKIYSEAFMNCTSLRTIYYEGSEQEWDKIIKGIMWDANTPAIEIKFNQKIKFN